MSTTPAPATITPAPATTTPAPATAAAPPARGFFRCHHALPAEAVTSALYRQLVAEWVELHGSPSVRRTLARWVRRHPVLSGLADPGAIVDHVDAAGPDTCDEVMIALLELAQAGQQLAGRVLLQMMLPALECLTRRTRGGSTDATWAEDQRHIVVAEFWGVITAYPVGRRRQKVAANLQKETLRAVVQPRAHRVEEVLTDEPLGTIGTDAFVDRIVDPIGIESSIEEVVGWALDRAIVTAAEADLLLRLCRSDQLNGSHPAVAAELGCSPAALRQRSSRAKRKLVDGVREQLLGIDVAGQRRAS